MASKTTSNTQMWPWLLGGGAVLVAIFVGVVAWERAQPGYGARQATDTEACRSAITTVRQYHAPGQTLNVETQAALTAQQGSPPMRLGAWTSRVSTANRCIVSLEAVVGNERQTYTWVYDRDRGTITADDDATKRVSGW